MIGQQISHYRITAKIGEGAMGDIYRAQDLRLQRPVAFKVLRHDHSIDREGRRRLLAEARAASALDHPNIVTVHDILNWRGNDIIVMEFVLGRTLRDLLAGGPLPVAEALRYAAQICDGVAAAHATGIVHRDLKPGNVMITEHGTVKVLDFGVAKITAWPGSSESPTATATRPGVLIGTPAYASPEQLGGLPADPRSDIFSVGVMLYEMLTGRRPFTAHGGINGLAGLIYEEAPPARTLRHDLPEPVDRLVSKAIAIDPLRRFQTMSDLLGELTHAREDLAPWPTRHTTIARVLERTRHMRPRRVAASFVLTVAAVGTALYIDGGGNGVPARQGEASPAVADAQICDEAFALLRRYDRAGNIDGAIERFQRVLSRDANSALAYTGLSLGYWRKFLDTQDGTMLDPAVSNARQAIAHSPLLASAHVALGLTLWRSDKPAARQALEYALTLEPHNADAHRGLGEILRSDRNLREAEIEFEKALAIRPEDWELQMLAGAVKFDQRRFADAEQAFKRSIGLAPDNPLPYRSLAGVCQMQNRTDEAVALLQKSLSIKPEAGAYNNYGALLFRKGLYHQAVQAFEQAVALRASNYMYWAQLGEGYWQIADKRDKSQEAFQRAIQLLAPQLERTPGDLNLRSRMALYRAKRGDSAGALLELTRIPGLLDLQDPVLLGRAIRIYELIGRRQQALAVLERMIAREYPVDDVRTDTDLQGLREDVRFHRLMARVRPVDGR